MTAEGGAAAELAADATARPWIAALAGHSPHLADLIAREPATLARMLERGPEEALQAALAPLQAADPASPRPALGGLLRQVKRRAALVIAAADVGGLWPLERVTGALTTLAEACLGAACRHLLTAAVARGELKRGAARAGRGCGLIVLGMGKLGARELNYSSDIDLILLFDPAAAQDPSEAQGIYVRIARELVRLLEERTAEGYVFRTDLRLRPDPAATPIAVHIGTAIAYYESLGATWERAAFIKARPVAGDIAAGEAFLREIRPFTWRRHLDFAALADIHSIKRQIHEHKAARGAGERIAVAGHDVKLGRGGIREVEFTTQALQLIWGGRDPALRDPTTLGALAALTAAGKLDRRAQAELSEAYVFLRTLEHRLQMIEDRQTHRLPEDGPGLARVASFLGFADTEAFAARLLGLLAAVESHYTRIFEGIGGGREAEAEPAAPIGIEDSPEALARLSAMGFREPASALSLIRGWQQGRVRGTRSERARALLQRLLPKLLACFAAEAEPDQVLARFDAMLSRISTGVLLLSLFERNPGLLKRVANILGAAPYLADHLANSPAAFEGLLSADPRAPLPIAARIREARHLEEALDAARRLATERRFDIDAAMLEGRLSADEAGLLRSDLADELIGALLPRIAADFAARYGRIPGGAMAILALGKLGGREMLPASDLDMVLLYGHAEGAEASRGGVKSLAPSEYFIRLAHQVVAALSAPGAEGRLFQVDMRLRPSGNKGPFATHIESFRRYHAQESWTWERMALTRARVVAGPPAFRRQVAAAVRTALLRPTEPGRVLADARAMRARMLRDLPPEGPWDLKAMRGGLIEVEFIAQALVLEHAARQPGLLAGSTRGMLAALGRAGLLPEAEELLRAEALWRTLLGLRRLMVAGVREAAPSRSAEAALLRGAGQVLGTPPVDAAALRAQIERHAEMVRAAFCRHLGDPEGAEAAPGAAPAAGRAAPGGSGSAEAAAPLEQRRAGERA
ncbi:MAG: bifunctional [glutamine synthetase] adenylyltransferase/[glutamine synthetase]-adenylyl-L-tyrosine phosphorylase [Rhodovarius sp.]|nr:bifunctional [glutamine synthetase] adenylyltransferase/[glutamine synthetase]-adenylyl-L-tyrosine phosphorylase [Rhodovarius sp.]